MCEKLKLVIQALWAERWQGCRGTMRAWCRRVAENKGHRWGALSMGGIGLHEVYKGSWLGQVVQWMHTNHVEIEGEAPIEGHMHNDVLLVELAPAHKRRVAQEGGGPP